MKRKILTAFLTLVLFAFVLQAKAETVTIYGSSSFTSITFAPTNGDTPIVIYSGAGTFEIPDGLYSVTFQMSTGDSNIPTAHIQHTWDAWMWDPYTNTSYQQGFSDTSYADSDSNSATYGQIKSLWCQVGESNNNVFYFYAY